MEAVQPKILKKETFKIVGLKYYGKNENNETQDLWKNFLNRCCEIKNKIDDSNYYGICKLSCESNKISYIASVKVSTSTDIPEEMVCKILPSTKYAIFTHKGSLKSLGHTYEYIYGTWLPNSSYEHSNLPDIEVFSKICSEDDIDNVIYIHIPIK
ncbi:GyrI-like domain-containing protein [Haloimpatiens sp. FM7330]|uniref:GyrI-like domain-containing protein n=1 Tax=Haloimpatiens sp. FM7330 TaxID=3298610 RepID=UPI0036259332